MSYPEAIDFNMVGEYPTLSKSGGGYFFDHVLEYRVWCYPTEEDYLNEECSGDYYYPFPTYLEAFEFFNKTSNSTSLVVLVKQIEWIDEPQPNNFIHKKEERITEWLPEWLPNSQRNLNSISDFLSHKN